METKNLFDLYTYNPFEESDQHIDDIIDYKNYKDLYEDFQNVVLKINQDIFGTFFKEDYNYSGKELIILPPNRVTFNLFLTSLTLQEVTKRHPKELFEITVYKNQLDIDFRYVNLYALIARNIKERFSIIYSNKEFPNYFNDPQSDNKILAALNFNFKFILVEKLKSIFFLKRKNRIFSVGRNYISREIETELFLKNTDTIKIKKDLLESMKFISADESFNTQTYLKINEIVGFNFSNLKDNYFSDTQIFNSFITEFSKTLSSLVLNLLSNKSTARGVVKDFKKQITHNVSVGNGLFSKEGIIIYDALKYNGIYVFSSSHGLTKGINKDSLTGFFGDESITSDAFFCYNQAAKSTRLANINNKMEIIVVGGNDVSKKIRFKFIQKQVLKNRLKMSGPIIFYVSHNIQLNGGKYFPYTKNNSQLFKDEKDLLTHLSKVNKQVVYKAYPTSQYYFDRSEYIKSHIYNFNNISYYEKEVDFRYLRSISDIVITQSSESTLEWCIGLDVPLIFLDSDYYEPLENENVKRAFKECFFFFNYDKTGWEKELIEFLNLPIKEINIRWKEKAIYRKKYDDIYLMSSKKNAGGIGSKVILKHING
ncbi:hypothetical protein OAR07_02610 [Flavobacteriaceae bacterium]|nr:hypothetical protein [Flavobacteriaceae bacterium]